MLRFEKPLLLHSKIKQIYNRLYLSTSFVNYEENTQAKLDSVPHTPSTKIQ